MPLHAGHFVIKRLVMTPTGIARVKLKNTDTIFSDKRLSSGGVQASTAAIARLARELQDENDRLKQPSFSLNPDSPIKKSNLIIIDECSMVDERMGEDLLSFGVPILVLGDPAQLPPVGGGGFFTGQKPDVMLDEIHRQARDNPIIDLATRVRNRQRLEEGEYGTSTVARGADRDLVMAADQILVGTNRKRRRCNAQMRKLLGHPTDDPMPVVGEKLVCLQNDHEAGLLNGTLWNVEASRPSDEYDNRYDFELTGESGEQVMCDAHQAHFAGTDDKMPYWELRDAQCFDYGYALTTHKAQGSQWEKVFVFNESGCFKSSAMNWLYTAITRASEEVHICN